MRKLLALLFSLVITALPCHASSYGGVYFIPRFPLQYHAATGFITAATSPTDVFTFYGSATKTVYVTKIEMTVAGPTNGTAYAVPAYLVKRSTANSGGTSTAVNAIPENSTQASATAVFKAYTANPSSLGTTVGTMLTLNVPEVGYINSSASTGANTSLVYQTGVQEQGIQLVGATEGLAINLGGVSVGNSQTVAIHIEWYEK